MGVKGKRKKKGLGEPTLLGNIDDIIKNAMDKNFVEGYKVSISDIIKEENMTIVKEDLPSSVSGYLKQIEGKWVIGVNKNHHTKRQRFTIAHEFAHYCLHRNANNYFEDTTFFREKNDTSIEYNANQFAAELLMPEDLFKEAVKKGIDKIKDLAEAFDVSALAIKYRASSLGFNIKSN